MKAHKLIKVVRRIEYFLFFIAFISLGLTFYSILYCSPSSTTAYCSSWGIGKTDSIRAIFVLLPIFGILNSLHIGLDHYTKVGYQNYTNLFNIGLFGLAMSYVMFAFFKISPLLLPIAQQNVVLALIYLIITLTTMILLADTNLWHKDSIFVKTRIATSLIYLVGSASYAVLGVILGLVVLPLNILINSKDE